MDFAAPEMIHPHVEINPKDCKKCNCHVGNAVSDCWDLGLCSTCFNHTDIETPIPVNSPLETKIGPAVKNPFSVYLDRYTHTEIKNLEKRN